MTIALLDINDSNLQLWHADQALQSPGYALLDGTEYTFGNDARAAARLHPRKINTRFWWQLSTQALQPALGPARHTGDLAHAHLLDIHQRGGEPEEILLSVSGSLQRDQLALALGIIEQCPFNAVGLVNRSVALASSHGGPGTLYHLEIQLHQSVMSQLTKNAETVSLERTIPLPGCGLLQLQERLVELIASAFIRQTRFDPRRKAETEQLLYDALPAALQALQSAAETNLEINGYRARIVRNELLAAGSRLFDSVSDAMQSSTGAEQLIMDPIASLLPGLREKIPQAELLPGDALPLALNQHLEKLVQRQQTLNFVTTLPVLCAQTQSTAVERAAPVEEAKLPQPTHFLRDAVAQPLEHSGSSLEDGLELYESGGSWLLRGERSAQAQVNGDDYIEGTPLLCGDSIVCAAGPSALLIAVLP